MIQINCRFDQTEESQNLRQLKLSILRNRKKKKNIYIYEGKWKEPKGPARHHQAHQHGETKEKRQKEKEQKKKKQLKML